MQRCSLEPWQKCAMQKCGQLEREWLVTPCVARISLIDGCYSASQSLGNYSFHGFSEELSDLHNFFLAGVRAASLASRFLPRFGARKNLTVYKQ